MRKREILHLDILHYYESGAYSPCMQGMHCMPSHLAKKENNNLNKYMLNLKQNQTKLPQLQKFTFKSK